MADTLELIQALPDELRERIQKEYIEIKLWQRKMQGWDEVNEAIELSPYCHRNKQVVNLMYCSNCKRSSCPRNYLCSQCFLNGENHYILTPPIYEEDCDECSKKSRDRVFA